MDDPWARVEEAANDRLSGAMEIARTAASAIAQLPEDRVMPAILLLLRAHPSMAPLWRLASEVLFAPEPSVGADSFVSLLQQDQGAVDELIGALPELSTSRVITISYSSSIIELVRRARPKAMFCMRSDPGGEGVRAAEAMSTWTAATVVDDDDTLTNVPGDAVVVGADSVTPDAVINKVKTRALTEAARAKGIAAYAVAGDTKFIGDHLPVAPAFEATSLELFTAVGAPDGLLDPKRASARALARPIHRDLLPLLNELSARS